MLELNQIQSTLLAEYINAKGDLNIALNQCGLQYNDFYNWFVTDKNFQKGYQITQENLTRCIKSENKMLSIRRLNEMLVNGVIHNEFTNHEVTRNKSIKLKTETGEEYIEVIPETTKTSNYKQKDLGVPLQAILASIKEENIEASINNLAQNNILPPDTCRSLLKIINEYQLKIQGVFDSEIDSGRISEKDAIKYIKNALLEGAIE